MNLKSHIKGTLLYLALVLLALPGTISYALAHPSSAMLIVSLAAISTALYSGAFWLRATQKASALHLTTELLLIFLTLAAVVLVFDLYISIPILLIPVAMVWLICAAGIGTANWAIQRWPGKIIMYKTALSITIISSLALPLLGMGTYVFSGAQAGHIGQPALVADADELATTKVIADLADPIVAGTNLVWCGTFQLAWNEMINLIGEDIQFANDEPACVARLNQPEMNEEHLDRKTCLSLAGPYTREFMKDANQAVASHFGTGAFAPESIPASDDPRNLAAMAYLVANLPFKHAFERTIHGMDFNGTHVESFSLPFSNDRSAQKEKVERQVLVQYPPEKGAFIVELLTRDRDHHLLLAEVTPEPTLAATIKKTLEQVDSLPREALGPNQQLEVPLCNFDITKSYNELTGKELATENRSFQNGRIVHAAQNIRFQLDERGAVMKSSSILVILSIPTVPDCVFDKPFLLMLRYKDSPMPYFAMWVDNAEILVEKK